MSDQFLKARGTLYIERSVKEKPQTSFLTNLFSGRNEAIDRDDLFAGSGKGSAQVATHIPGDDIIATCGTGNKLTHKFLWTVALINCTLILSQIEFRRV